MLITLLTATAIILFVAAWADNVSKAISALQWAFSAECQTLAPDMVALVSERSDEEDV